MHYEGNHKKIVKMNWTCLEKKKHNDKISKERGPDRKKLLSRSHLRWEGGVKSDVKAVDPRAN